MREVELKAVIADPQAIETRLAEVGAGLEFRGVMRDKRYDTLQNGLSSRDEVLRFRTYHSEAGVRASLDWKGPAEMLSGYKVREEISTGVTDAEATMAMLQRLGYVVIREIDRRIAQYRLGRTMLRVEVYPRMDALIEIEGDPPDIESAIDLLQMRRGDFTAEALSAFVSRFER